MTPKLQYCALWQPHTFYLYMQLAYIKVDQQCAIGAVQKLLGKRKMVATFYSPHRHSHFEPK